LEFYSNYGSIITTLSKAQNRLGFYKEDKVYRKEVYNYLIPFSVDVPISTTYLQFAKLLNCHSEITELKIEINEGNHWQGITAKLGIDKSQEYVVVNPNASDLRLERRWPKESFIGVMNTFIQQNKPHKIILMGDKTEVAYVSEIERSLNNSNLVINSAGKLHFSELIVLIANAKLMLTNDTGPMHVAFAVKTKTISLFGPCSPKQYGMQENAITFYKNVHCSPCVHQFIIPPCRGDNQCMKQISEKEVAEALLKDF
jgi:ADP-heptose:LPS heptosyltransferase